METDRSLREPPRGVLPFKEIMARKRERNASAASRVDVTPSNRETFSQSVVHERYDGRGWSPPPSGQRYGHDNQGFRDRDHLEYRGRSPNVSRSRETCRDDRWHHRRSQRSPPRHRSRSPSNRRRSRSPLRRDREHGKNSTIPKELAEPPIDPTLRPLDDDPRSGRTYRQTTHGRKGLNTESFDPRSTLVRPAMRVRVGPNTTRYSKPLKHDDVIVVPEFFCGEDDWNIYYQLVEEMRTAQAAHKDNADWIAWHEGCHLISKGPEHSPTFKKIIEKAAAYFDIELESVGTRFNWYRDDKDWKPFHHDSAAFNPKRAKNQNITVGFSFGGERELAFIHAESGLRAYFPQSNGMLFSFGRDVNINWKHGVNAVDETEYTGKGRISIVLWGKVRDVIEEDGSPPLVISGRGSGGRGRGGRGRGGRGRR